MYADVTDEVEYADGLALVDLLRLMLRWEPTARPAVVDLLTHPWFSGGHPSVAWKCDT
jgi:hypothetical protein